MDPITIITIVGAALAVSEGLSLIPGIRANGIFQLIYFILKAIAGAGKTKEVK